MITLEQVNSSVVEKKKNLNKQNFDGGANWSSIVNFHCIHRVEFVMSMRFIFGDK